MKIRLLFALFLSFSALQAQKQGYAPETPYTTTNCRSYFQKITLEDGNNVKSVDIFLKGFLPNLADNRCSLRENYTLQSLAGIHYSFTQLFNGIPVYQSEIKVNTDKGNTIQSIFDNSYDTKNRNPDVSTAGGNSVLAIDPQTGELVLALDTVLNQWQEILRANGEIIYSHNLNEYFAGHDSTVSGMVYSPDPITTANEIYGGKYVNNNNQDAPWLDQQEIPVAFKANFNDTVFTLANEYFQILDFDSPQVAPATSTVPQFNFHRPQTGLEDIMAWYHLNFYREYIAGMGFNNSNHSLWIDTHACSGADNSYFSSFFSPPRLFYGTGGVPDCQDADVLLHEFGHFLSFNAAPNSNTGEQRNALDEGFADYNAASYSKSINTFNDQWIFNWDGHNEYWAGRVVNSIKIYPKDLDNNIYDDGEIWSSALFSINNEIGRGPTDSLIIEAHYSYVANMIMSDAAQILIHTDTLLFNGAHYCQIYQQLLNHGLMPFDSNNTCGITGSSLGIHEVAEMPISFLQNGYSFTIVNKQAVLLQSDIYSITGQKIASMNNGSAKIYYSNEFLPSGMYIVEVSTSNARQAYKWIKIM